MKYEEYFKCVIEKYPHMHFDRIMNSGWNRVDIIKKVAELMFIDGEVHTTIAIETRKQLVSLRDNGMHCFDKVDK